MANSLDKLKELTGRLEEKLAQKRLSERQDTPLQDDVSSSLSSRKKPISSDVGKRVEKKDQNNETIGSIRASNMRRVKSLYQKLGIDEKAPDFERLFDYKAMNLSGIGLKEEDFAQVREGKYIQIIAITYEPDKNGKKRAKNVSLGYFGKAETLQEKLKNEIIEFVLRWRYEKAFQNLKHYKELIERLEPGKPTQASLF